MVQKRNKRPALLHHLIYSGVREWSLITGRGGGVKLYPYGGGGGGKGFNHAEGGGG